MSDITALQKQSASDTAIVAGFTDSKSFAHMQRVAMMLSASELVPQQFRGEAGLPNCVIALEMAQRMGTSALAIMQQIYVVHGKPGWSSQFIIACVNSSGRYSPLRFQITGEGDAKTCVAWVLEKGTNERLESPPVSIDMAKKEGWFSKNGSKWQTMPDLMLRYRAATLFGRLYAPEILMGMRTVEEILDVDTEVIAPTTVSAAPVFGKPAAELPAPKEEKPANVTQLPPQEPAKANAEEKPAGQPAGEQKADEQQKTPQEQIANLMTDSRVTYDDFQSWLKTTGQLPDAEKYPSYADLPTEFATKLAKDTRSLSRCIRIYGKAQEAK